MQHGLSCQLKFMLSTILIIIFAFPFERRLHVCYILCRVPKMLSSGVQCANKGSYEKLTISYTVLSVRYGLTLKKIR